MDGVRKGLEDAQEDAVSLLHDTVLEVEGGASARLRAHGQLPTNDDAGGAVMRLGMKGVLCQSSQSGSNVSLGRGGSSCLARGSQLKT